MLRRNDVLDVVGKRSKEGMRRFCGSERLPRLVFPSRVFMPTILQQEGFKIRIFVDDHEPPHVHARCDQALVVVNLAVAPGQVPTIRTVKHASAETQRSALRIVMEHNDLLLEHWSRIHG